jgi:hypothetical protein
MFKCQCDQDGILNPLIASWYDPVTELPYVKHAPNKCKCINDLQQYIRKGKQISLCSCCNLPSDVKV